MDCEIPEDWCSNTSWGCLIYSDGSDSENDDDFNIETMSEQIENAADSTSAVNALVDITNNISETMTTHSDADENDSVPNSGLQCENIVPDNDDTAAEHQSNQPAAVAKSKRKQRQKKSVHPTKMSTNKCDQCDKTLTSSRNLKACANCWFMMGFVHMAVINVKRDSSKSHV